MRKFRRGTELHLKSNLGTTEQQYGIMAIYTLVDTSSLPPTIPPTNYSFHRHSQPAPSSTSQSPSTPLVTRKMPKYNKIRADEDEERGAKMQGKASFSDELAEAPIINTPAVCVEIGGSSKPCKSATQQSLDELLSEYVVPTPFVNGEERKRETAKNEAPQEDEDISEYQLLDSDGECEGEEEYEDKQITRMFRPSLEERMGYQAGFTARHALTAQVNESEDRVVLMWQASSIRQRKIDSFIAEGLSAQGAAFQADVLFEYQRMRTRKSSYDAEISAFLQKCDHDLASEHSSALSENNETYAGQEEDGLEPLINRDLEDKVWNAWCATCDHTPEKIAKYFEKRFLCGEEKEEYQAFAGGMTRLWVSHGDTEAEATGKLKNFCAWAVRKHKAET
jgi:hypothetical protein